MTETEYLLSPGPFASLGVCHFFFCCRGCSGPPALQKQNRITFCLDPNDSCLRGSPGMGLQTVGERLSQRTSWLTHPLCVFQSAEFFEMLEKMQVSIPKVGKPSPGWGACCSHRGATTPGRTWEPWREGQRRENSQPGGRDHLRPFCVEWPDILGRLLLEEGEKIESRNPPAEQMRLP